jgi:probable rRNA maturation factor
VKIIIKNFQKKVPICPTRIKKVILKAFSQEALKKTGDITICFVTDKKIRELNLRYLGRNKPTDVLTFDNTSPLDNTYMFADIIISTDTAMRNAKIFKTPPPDELNLYAVHGALHLLGYDDHTPKQRKLMRQKEEEYVHT